MFVVLLVTKNNIAFLHLTTSVSSISDATFFSCSRQPDEDVSGTFPRDRTLKSVSFQETVSVISASPAVMELESQQIQHGCLSSPSNRQHVAGGMQEPPDSVVVQVCVKAWSRGVST